MWLTIYKWSGYTKPATRRAEAPMQVSPHNVSHALITGFLWLTIFRPYRQMNLSG